MVPTRTPPRPGRWRMGAKRRRNPCRPRVASAALRVAASGHAGSWVVGGGRARTRPRSHPHASMRIAVSAGARSRRRVCRFPKRGVPTTRAKPTQRANRARRGKPRPTRNRDGTKRVTTPAARTRAHASGIVPLRGPPHVRVSLVVPRRRAGPRRRETLHPGEASLRPDAVPGRPHRRLAAVRRQADQATAERRRTRSPLADMTLARASRQEVSTGCANWRSVPIAVPPRPSATPILAAPRGEPTRDRATLPRATANASSRTQKRTSSPRKSRSATSMRPMASRTG